MKNNKLKRNSGITLIALVITIFVMLILVAVTTAVAVNGGLFEYAGRAGAKTNEAVTLEQELGSGKIKVGGKWYASIDAYLAKTPIDQDIIIDETLEKNEFTLEIEDGYNPATGTPVTKKLNPTLIGIEGTPTWESSDEDVAKVNDNGLVTAIGLGTAEITVSVTYRDEIFTDICKVTIEEAKQYLGMTNEETDSGIGCYVYVDGQYGVIYADLAFARPASENHHWSNDNGAYSWEAEDHTQLKKYYKNGKFNPSEEGYGTAWEEKPLLVVDETQGGSIDRFYVMALTDFTVGNDTTFYWDKNYSRKTFGTSKEFKSGSDNTYNKLMNTELITWADQDIWKNLTDADGWFVPSRAEWSAFAKELGVYENYSSYGLSDYYWSSSQLNTKNAWHADFIDCYMVNYSVYNYAYVRLSTTF